MENKKQIPDSTTICSFLCRSSGIMNYLQERAIKGVLTKEEREDGFRIYNIAALLTAIGLYQKDTDLENHKKKVSQEKKELLDKEVSELWKQLRETDLEIQGKMVIDAIKEFIDIERKTLKKQAIKVAMRN